MPNTSPRLAREIAKILHQFGEPTSDGRLSIRPEEIMAEVAQLDLLAPAPKRGQDDGADDVDDGDDPGDPGGHRAARAEGQRLGRAAREQRERSEALWGR